MGKMIYYGDNIFLVGETIRVLKDALQLDADPTLFSEKIVDDIFFVDRSLVKLYESLSANPLLIDRNDHLGTLMRDENLFADLLDEVVGGQSKLSGELRPMFEKLDELSAVHRTRVAEIREVLTKAESNVGESGDMISPAEYEFLLIDKESEE